MMILYRGSNMAVEQPMILDSGRKLDFGVGFYLTSSFEQAVRWAKLTTERQGTGTPTVTVYEVDDSAFASLTVKLFAAPNAKWLRYVVSNRKGTCKAENADVVTGPVANDQTMPTITQFLIGELSLAETIRRLRPQQLKDQYVFKNETALKLLTVREVIKP